MRHLFALAVLCGAMAAGAQETTACATAGNNNTFLNIQTIRLWEGAAPEARGTSCDDIPTLTILAPRKGAENGSAVIVLPGGGYAHLAGDLEGREVGDWFAARGFRAFVLSYRLTSHGYALPVPLYDARRAVQLVRAHAAEYRIDPQRIAMIGFSAGGHLAGLAGTQFVEGKPEAADPVERVSSRPDYLILGYAWLGAVSLDTTHLNYCKVFKLMDQCDALSKAYTPELFVSSKTPPTFIYHTYTDQTVPVSQALGFFNALLKNGVPAEMHVFGHGAHGTGLGRGDAALDQWPNLLENWLRAQGLLTAQKVAH
jgi:acetyl esterase/lipase